MKKETRGRKPLLEKKATHAIWHRVDKETYEKWLSLPLKRRRNVLNAAILREFQRISEGNILWFEKINENDSTNTAD